MTGYGQRLGIGGTAGGGGGSGIATQTAHRGGSLGGDVFDFSVFHPDIVEGLLIEPELDPLTNLLNFFHETPSLLLTGLRRPLPADRKGIRASLGRLYLP
jgi:hypothetical protein